MDENYSSLREEAPGPGNDQAAARGVGSRAYTVYETVFAVITILSGYLFTRMWPASSHPFGALLFTLFLFVTGGIWLKLSGGRQGLISEGYPFQITLLYFIHDLTHGVRGEFPFLTEFFQALGL